MVMIDSVPGANLQQIPLPLQPHDFTKEDAELLFGSDANYKRAFEELDTDEDGEVRRKETEYSPNVLVTQNATHQNSFDQFHVITGMSCLTGSCWCLRYV